MSTRERRRDPSAPGLVIHRRRRRDRVAVDLQARIADTPTIVDLRDLTPDGVAFDSEQATEIGRRVVLLTRVCNADGVRRDIALPVIVRWTRHSHHGWHIGAEFAGVDDATRTLLTEYCMQAASSHRRHAAA